MRRKKDIVFIGIVAVLLLSGFFILSSASLGLASKGKAYYFTILKQVFLGGGVGLILLFLTSKLHYRHFRKWALLLFIASFILTILVVIPNIGFSHGGAQRWFSIGPITFQPSELLKFAFVVYLSSWLVKRKDQINNFSSGFLPFLIIMGFVAVALIIQPDMGTLGVISITGMILFFLSGGKIFQTGILIFLGLLVISVLAYLRPYMLQRILVFQNSSYDIQDSGYQLNQAKIALGSGGIFGRGFGQGRAKFNYLPEPVGDSIFAVVGEEFGFIGTMSLISLFFLFFYKSMRIALKAPDPFGRLLVSGIAILIVVQCFINMSANVGLVPLTGLPLIFISQGGSALMLALAEVGVIINVSKHS